MKPAQLKPWQERYPNTLLINMYGITETTVHVTYKEIGAKEIATDTSNIGTPIPTLTAYVLDRHMHMQPVGAAGQLYVGGAGVARGYLNRPGLTCEKFKIINYNALGPRRFTIYKTGDLVRLLENLDMEYLGRIDQQVKIRGFRIEPGEIENRLLKKTGIKNALVLAKKDERKDQYLCAYIVADEKLDLHELRKSLAAELPMYMIPAYLIPIHELPLTPNGKIDRRALPEPRIENLSPYVAPRDEVEKKLTAIWSELLGIENGTISIGANFFELGGHSLKATIMASQIYKTFNVEVSIKEIFKASTIKAIAAIIKTLTVTDDKRAVSREQREEIIL